MKSNLQIKSGRRGARLTMCQLLMAALCSSTAFANVATAYTAGPTANVAVDISISGKVTDGENGESLPGVNVVLKGSTVGTTTDAAGNYKINVPNKSAVLIFPVAPVALEAQVIILSSTLTWLISSKS